MIKINHYYTSPGYEHICSACGRILASDRYEKFYTVEMDKLTVKLCTTCRYTLARKLSRYNG